MGAAVMVLPPLALGAIFYAMLPPPDDEDPGGLPSGFPAAVEGAPPPLPASPAPTAVSSVTDANGAITAAVPPGTLAAVPGGVQSFAMQPAASRPEEIARSGTRAPIQGRPAEAGPATAYNGPPPDAEGSLGTPPAPPKKPARRRAQKPAQQDEYPVRTFLQEIGIWPRPGNGKDGRGG